MIDSYIEQFVQAVDTLPMIYIYLVFFGVAYLENIVPPIPGDLLVAFGGYLAAVGIVQLLPVYLLTTIASVAGFMSVYALGNYWGTQIEEKRNDFWMFRWINMQYIYKVQAWMQRWGQGVILANRFLAGTRSVISLTAGISHTRIRTTIISSLVSSLLWNGILLGLGWIVKQNWRIIGHYLTIYSRSILITIFVLILLRFTLYIYRRNFEVNNE
jgi:membrane protein DedA with SNARE-associated domain